MSCLRTLGPPALLLVVAGCGEPDGFGMTDSGQPSCVANPLTNGVEDCNGIDDDCDGIVDEGISSPMLRRPCETECGSGTEMCTAGAWAGCSAPAAETETCNGLDDDCDDEIDEGCGCPHGDTRACGSDIGACRAGIEQCINGAWNGECFGEVGPSAEVCNNGIDDNCADGIDEGCQCAPGDTQICGTDVGECSAGVLNCEPGGQWMTVCEGEVTGNAEVCNGLDDDCDGEVDLNTATGFGWGPDPSESNDTCISGLTLPTAVDSGAWIQVPVSDPDDISTFPTVYPPGDVDWYEFRAETISHGACVPGTSQCAFVLTVQLELSSAAAQGDYEVCIAAVENCSGVTSANQFCSDAGDWNANVNSYLIGIKWGGTCGADDSRTIKAVVRNTSGALACEYYQLHARFRYDDTQSCP